MLRVSGTRVTVRGPSKWWAPPGAGVCEEEGSDFHGWRREESGPLPGYFCFLCICCPQCILGGNPEKVGSSWATEPNRSRAGPYTHLLTSAHPLTSIHLLPPAPLGAGEHGGAGCLFSSVDREHLEGKTMTCFARPLPGTQ